jgi:cytochrome P450 PksS
LEVSLPQFDIVSPSFHASPAHTLEQIRATGLAVVRMKLPIFGKIWMCVTHESCGAMLKDKEMFVRDPANAGIQTQARVLKVLPRSIGLLALNMLGHDDPEHRHLRGLVDQAFQRRGIEAMRPMIRGVADQLLDRLAGRDEVDLMEDFCRDLPLSVICVMLGLPDSDHQRFKDWLGGLKDTANIAAVIRAVPGVLRVVRYLRNVSRSGGDAKPDGLISALREAEVDGRKLSEDELVSMIFLLFGAGQETTTHLISGGLLELLRHEDQRRRLQADISMLPLCVEECLRHVSPVQLTKPRWASRDGQFAGREFRRGESIAAFLTAANRDPHQFDNPHVFDITRRPNPHLSFGTGVHFCLGFQLARAEAAIAFERILERFPAIRLAVDPAAITWRKRLGIRALAKLPVRLR